MRDWDNPSTSVAGLLHSIYGTEFFKHKSLSDRHRLAEMIGHPAEELVNLFCAAKDRPLFQSIVDDNARRQLQVIEAANVLEQDGASKTLRKLVQCKISAGARAALRAELALR